MIQLIQFKKSKIGYTVYFIVQHHKNVHYLQ